MSTKTRIVTFGCLGIAALLLLTSCFAPETAHQTVEVLRQTGKFSDEQLQAILQAMTGGPDQFWSDIFEETIRIGTSLVLGYFGITAWRGSPGNRKGVAPLTT